MPEERTLLPPQAQILAAQIEAALDQADQLLGNSAVPTDAAYGVRAMRRDYLPQTIARYEAVPAQLRSFADNAGCSAESMLLDQLSVLLRAANGYVETLAEHSRNEQAVQGRFLRERFNDRSTTIATVEEGSLPAPVAKRYIEHIIDHNAPAASIITAAAQRFSEMLPRCTRIERGGIFGAGPIKAVHITIPDAEGNAFRYSLEHTEGFVTATCTQIVRNVPLKTIPAQLPEWLSSLEEELLRYAQHHAEVRRFLDTLAKEHS